MIYMLQIFDRIFISKSILLLLTISGYIIFLYYFSLLWVYSVEIVISLGMKIEKKVNEKLFNVGFEQKLKKAS